MTDTLVESIKYAVEVEEIDWYGYHEDHEQLGEGPSEIHGGGMNMNAKAVWTTQNSGIKTFAEADAFAQKLLTVYRKVRLVKTVKFIETIYGEDTNA